MQVLDVAAVVRRDGFELDVAVHAERGETLGIVGDIGSGKSTLLALVAGLVRADRGRVRGLGTTWDDPAAGVWTPPAQRAVSHLAQRPVLLDDVAAVEQVVAAMGPRRDGNGAALAARRDAAELLAVLGVAPNVAARDGWTLSGGEAQRVALAITFARTAPLVLLDDPFRALDSRTGNAVRRWLAERLRSGAHTTLVACSDPADTLHLADRIVELP